MRRPTPIVYVFAFVGAAAVIDACRTINEPRPGEVRVELCDEAARFLRKITGHDAVTLPLPGVSIELLPPRPTPALICHEGVHAEQRDRMGEVAYAEAYAAGTLAHGYQGNPLEVEARDRCDPAH